MEDNNHLPEFGVGPLLIVPIVIATIVAILLSFLKIIPVYSINQINLILTVIGVFLIILGAIFWISAVKKSDIDDNIRQNNLVTTGIYGYVRHPIYSAFLYAVTGVILILNNILLFVLPVIYWIILTIAMIKTEEKWLTDLYGKDYLDYSKKVNRFIPKGI
jgi:protein-S-isoprenylcysteine O-methyltransferase Ste14